MRADRARTLATSSRCVAAAAALLVSAATACESSDGRELPPPAGGATAAPETVAPPAVELFALSSEGIDVTGRLEEAHTCHGAGTSPPLRWTGTPPAAQLALVARDRDEGTIHWVVGGIDPAALGFGAGGLPEGAVPASVEGAAVAAEPATGWVPPCPTGPDDLRTVDLALHALPEPVELQPGIPAAEAAGLIEGTSVDAAVLVATVATTG